MKLPWHRQKIKRNYEGKRIDLEITGHEVSHSGHYRSVLYGIYLHDTNTKIGECDIRIGSDDNQELYYAGDAGYRIYSGWRGHGYAYDACCMMITILHDEYDMDHMLLTCSPDNIASRKTIEKAGGHLLEETDVPSWHWLYKRGEKVKLIYRINM